MKNNIVFGLLILALSILVIAGCATPPPKPEPAPAPTSGPAPVATVEPSEGLILEGAFTHVVERGDTLSDLAASNYGWSNMFFFPLIRLANDYEVPDPDAIEVGMNLTIPQLQPNLDNFTASGLLRNDMLSVADQYERQNKPNAAHALRNLAWTIPQ